MKTTTKLFSSILCSVALLAFGCGDTEDEVEPSIESEVSKEEASQMEGKSDAGGDLCDVLGWYGDGICDEFCVRPDPDCGETGCTSDSECASDEICDSGSCVAATAGCGGFAGVTCPTGQFCDFAIDDMCGGADQMGTCEPRPDTCSQQYDPVCGCDGQTYSNSCTANAAGVSVASDGACAVTCSSDENCTAGQVCQDGTCIDDPGECQTDSDCDTGQECVDGTCEDSGEFCGGFAGFTCADDEWCEYFDSGTACGAADGGGTCQRRPEACAQLYDPVCGCDGKTYSNECTANAAGTDIVATGPCI